MRKPRPVRDPLPDDHRVAIAPFTVTPEDDDVIVGWAGSSIFLVMEPAAARVLEWFAGGATVGEVRRRYRDRYRDDVELEPLLDQLGARGLILPAAGDSPADGAEARAGDRRLRDATRFHLEGVSPRTARLWFGPPTVIVLLLLAAAGAVTLLVRPDLLPSWRALYFPHGLGFYGTLLLGTSLLLVATHEMGHFLAARAAGVSCRFGIGTRLWIPVAETDMTGVWAIPRARRYLPILAGPLVDLAGAGTVTLALLVSERFPALPAGVPRFLRAVLLIYLLSLLWQCYLFVRTDFYYVLANLLRCKSLMKDTERYVYRLAARWLPLPAPRETLPLPPHEARAVRGFAVLWLGGRALAVGALVFIQIPILWSYLTLLAGALGRGARGDPPAEALAPALLALPLFAIGLGLWLHRLVRRKEPT